MLIEQFEKALTAAQSTNNYLPFFSEGLQARFRADVQAQWSPDYQDSLKRVRKVLKVVRQVAQRSMSLSASLPDPDKSGNARHGLCFCGIS